MPQTIPKSVLRNIERAQQAATTPDLWLDQHLSGAARVARVSMAGFAQCAHGRLVFRKLRNVPESLQASVLELCRQALTLKTTVILPLFPPNPSRNGDASTAAGAHFFAGVPVIDAQDVVHGLLFVMDTAPNSLNLERCLFLKAMADSLCHFLAESPEVPALQGIGALPDHSLPVGLVSIGLIAAELRSPLLVINGLTKAALEEAADGKQDLVLGYLQLLQSRAAKMNGLLARLLEFVAFPEGPLHTREIALPTLIDDIQRDLEIRHRHPHVVFSVDVPPTCHADPVLLRQALTNLLSNALKFTRHCTEPRIAVTSTQSAGTLTLCVGDNGAGFRQEEAARLFQLFQRLHRQDEYPGHGIGLSLVKQIVRRHGGDVWADSRPGQGARFFLNLPQRPGPASAVAS